MLEQLYLIESAHELQLDGRVLGLDEFVQLFHRPRAVERRSRAGAWKRCTSSSTSAAER